MISVEQTSPWHHFIPRWFFHEIAGVFLAKRQRAATGNRSANTSTCFVCSSESAWRPSDASIANGNRRKKHRNSSSTVNIFSGVPFEKNMELVIYRLIDKYYCVFLDKALQAVRYFENILLLTKYIIIKPNKSLQDKFEKMRQTSCLCARSLLLLFNVTNI